MTPLRRLNTYRIFDCSLGKLAGLCRITIWSRAIQPLNWARSDPEKSGESGNVCPLSLGFWGGVRATRAANDSALANCVLTARTSSPDCLASRVISSSSCHNSSSVPAVLGILLASSDSCLNVSSCCSNVELSHSGGRNCCFCRSVICFCNSIICAGWSHTLSTMAAGSLYCATILSTPCAPSSSVCLSAKSISNRFLLTIPPMMSWSSADTRATRSCCSDPDIATNQAHLVLPIICVKSEWVGVRGSITIKGTGAGFAVAAAAGACPSVECVPKQPCPSQSQCSSGWLLNQVWAPQYVVQLFPKTGWSSSKPTPYAVASVH